MPEGNKIWVSGDGVESNRQATNSPGIPVDSNRFDCVVKKVGLGAETRRHSPVTKMEFHFMRSNKAVWCGESVHGTLWRGRTAQ